MTKESRVERLGIFYIKTEMSQEHDVNTQVTDTARTQPQRDILSLHDVSNPMFTEVNSTKPTPLNADTLSSKRYNR